MSIPMVKYTGAIYEDGTREVGNRRIANTKSEYEELCESGYTLENLEDAELLETE